MINIICHQGKANSNNHEITLHYFFYNQKELIKSAVRVWKSQNLHTLLVEVWNGAATLEKNLAVQQKIKHRIAIGPSNSTYRYLSRPGKPYVHTKLVYECSQENYS